jgi:ribosomal protein L32
MQALEEKFQQVKDYLRENPDASVEQTATDNDVTTKQIKQWVKEERLILSTATDSGVVCETCGKPIRSGRLCEKCKAALQSDMEGAIDRPAPKEEAKPKQRDGNKMRFLQS